jgi:ABC-type glutathione transport system ATPase component
MMCGVEAMYTADAAAKNFFEWAANRKNDAAETRIAYIAQRAMTDYQSATKIAKTLAGLGCGEFVHGRRGGETRIVWKVSLKNLGLAAKESSAA